jgi:hypothetical protein
MQVYCTYIVFIFLIRFKGVIFFRILDNILKKYCLLYTWVKIDTDPDPARKYTDPTESRSKRPSKLYGMDLFLFVSFILVHFGPRECAVLIYP